MTIKKDVAKEFWIQELNTELDSLFGKDIPVLLTSQLLLDVLLNDDLLENGKRPARFDAMELYTRKKDFTISSEQNKLGRPLIAVYRGRNPKTGQSYMFLKDQHSEYANRIKLILKTN